MSLIFLNLQCVTFIVASYLVIKLNIPFLYSFIHFIYLYVMHNKSLVSRMLGLRADILAAILIKIIKCRAVVSFQKTS